MVAKIDRNDLMNLLSQVGIHRPKLWDNYGYYEIGNSPTGYIFAKTETDHQIVMARNALYDDINNQWDADDSTEVASYISFENDGSIDFAYAAAAANPSFTVKMSFDGLKGRLGVGTAAPVSPLEIIGASKQLARFETTTASENNYVNIMTSGASSSIGIQLGLAGAGNMSGIRGGGELRFVTGGTDGSALDDATPAVIITPGEDVGIQETTPSKALDVKNGASGGDILCYDIYTHDGGVETSDIRFKENIQKSLLGLDFILRLNPVSYKWKHVDKIIETGIINGVEEVINIYSEENYIRTHYGLISQEVKTVLDNLKLSTDDFAGYIYEKDKDKYGLRYTEFIAPLIKAVQELSKEVETLKKS